MRRCWSEGALRAYLDRELPPEDMERVAAHLGECPRCEACRTELAGRAAREVVATGDGFFDQRVLAEIEKAPGVKVAALLARKLEMTPSILKRSNRNESWPKSDCTS